MSRPTSQPKDQAEKATVQAKQAAHQLQEDPTARDRSRRRVGEYLDLPASLAAVLIVMLLVAGDAQRSPETGEATSSNGENTRRPPDDTGTIRLSEREIQVLRAILARLERQ